MRSSKTLIVDYGVGNLYSVKKAVEFLGCEAHISSDPSDVSKAERVIFPGVGAFPASIRELKNRGLDDAVAEFAVSQRPMLAICVGLQLLMDWSNEFSFTEGLKIFQGGVVKIPTLYDTDKNLKLPNIGWSKVEVTDNVSKLSIQGQYYFLHSFMVVPQEPNCVVGVTRYGDTQIPAIMQNGNLVGCQFHPEKSGPQGLKFLKSFYSL